jgi:hypothetical protein
MVASLFVVDHPRVYSRHRNQVITLDRAITEERELIAHLEQLLGAEVRHLSVRRVDLVNDLTVVDVRYRLRSPDTPKAGRATPRGAERGALA